MKITTKKQLLITIILINVLVFSAIGAVLYYYDGIWVLYPLIATTAAMIAIQYNRRKKQLPEV